MTIPLPFALDDLPAKVILDEHHYLGAPKSGAAWIYRDEFGVIVFSPPKSRRLPQRTWLELSRWCLVGTKNGGSQQWARAWRWARERFPHVTTFVSYSDPAAGHTGSLYRACNWRWAPTWHRLRPPPTGNGEWIKGKAQAVKDRWIFPVLPDPNRGELLAVDDAGLVRRFPWASYVEPRFRGGVAVHGTGGANYKRWTSEGGPDGL